LDPVQQREALKVAHTYVAALEATGLVVAAGTDLLRLTTADGRPFSMEVLHVVVSSAHEPKLFALRDKTAPVRFA
jgi:hypothetical protein